MCPIGIKISKTNFFLNLVTLVRWQRDQIWRIFATLGNFEKLKLVFGKLLCYWASFLCNEWTNIEK